MNCLAVDEVSKSFGEKILFQNISFGLDIGQKAALIARNGIGKSSLLNIICGLDTPDSGSVTIRKDLYMAYLPQNPEFPPYATVIEVLLASDNTLIRTVRQYELALVRLRMAETPENQRCFEDCMAEMDRLNAWDFESQMMEILGRFHIDKINQPCCELSGGMRKKLALAKTLIEEVDVLILDEPTNHLDIEMIEWLEDYLTREKLSLLLVTHDRYFLDSVCDTIFELENGYLYKYNGNYAYYLEKKAEREYNQSAELEKTRGIYRQELEWMRQSPQARTSKAKARIEAFYELKEKSSVRLAPKPAELQVKTQRVGNKILELNNICKSYGDQKLVDDFSHVFKRGEKVGIVGRNGIGKTTLMQMISGEIRPDKGRVVKGQTIAFGHFSQEGIHPPDEKRIVEIVKEVAEVIPLGDGREMSASQFLFHFGFNYDTQYNYYHNLSGGERRKLSLLITLMQNPNFLLLDEPTNDLDIYTLNVLEDFLIHFAGCVMFISHDRFFLDKIADHIFVFEGEGKIKDFYGSYSVYRRQKDRSDAILRKKRAMEKPKKEISRPKTEIIKLSYKENIEFEELEKEIPVLELEKAALLDKMNSGNGSGDDLRRWSVRFAEIESVIEEKTLRWLELSERSGS
ncbi:MAG: ABC-F family ATP-binding cassette domain-containing protein [Bacteroidetes bacterium]|nr:ABC-F family ATP-binding cassette domain-containing protein [Bacteroidota bacterium]